MAFTFFFRDAQTLELALDHAAIAFRNQPAIDIWDAGCAHGPESYTLAMLLRERVTERVFENVRIHATDIDQSFATSVTTGVFPEQQVKRVQPEFLDKYFVPADAPGFVQVVSELRERVTFSHHDLLSLQPIREGLSLIVCKNVLLHFAEEQRLEVLQMFYAALRPGGLLVMEHTQKLPEALRSLFQAVVSHAQIYRKPAHVRREHSASSAPHVTALCESIGAERYETIQDGPRCSGLPTFSRQGE